MIRSLATENWITILFIILFGILVLVNYLFPVKFKHFTAFFKREQFYIKYFKTFVKTDLFFLLFTFFSILIYSFIIFKLYLYFKKTISNNTLLLYLEITNFTFWYVIFRHVLEIIIGYFFKIKNFQDSILFYKWIHLSKNAMILLPFIIIFHYYNLSSGFVILSIIMSIVLVYNYFVLLQKKRKNIFNHLFYFILYLCTLEIAPLIIYLKIVFKE
jgi:hypothetical protein